MDPFQQLFMSMVPQMLASMFAHPDWIPGPMGGNMNPVDFARELDKMRHRMTAQSEASAAIAEDWIPMFRGFFRDDEWTAAHEQQVRDLAGYAGMVLPFIGTIAPDMVSMMGPSATIWSLAGSLVDAYHLQGMTGEHAAQLAKDLAAEMRKDNRHRGFDPVHFGQWIQQGMDEGWGPVSTDPNDLSDWLRGIAESQSAARDLFPWMTNERQRRQAVMAFTLGGDTMTNEEMGLHLRQFSAFADLSGMDRMAGMQRFGGIQAVAGQYAASIGGRQHFGQEAGIHAAAFNVGLQRAGLADMRDYGFAKVTNESLLQQTSMLAVQARMSQGFNILAATIRLGREVGFDKDSQAYALYEALQSGQQSYIWDGKRMGVHEGDWQSIMQGGGIDARIAANARMDFWANQAALNQEDQQNLNNIVRAQQWERDIAPHLQMGAVHHMQSGLPGLNRSVAIRASGIIAETVRSFNVESDLSVEELVKQRHAAVVENLEKAGISDASKIATVGIGGMEWAANQMNYESLHHAIMMHNRDALHHAAAAGEEAAAMARKSRDAAHLYRPLWHRLIDGFKDPESWLEPLLRGLNILPASGLPEPDAAPGTPAGAPEIDDMSIHLPSLEDDDGFGLFPDSFMMPPITPFV